jgi:hypothetical protein
MNTLKTIVSVIFFSIFVSGMALADGTKGQKQHFNIFQFISHTTGILLSQPTEIELEVQSWMVNPEYLQVEKDIEIENWMLNPAYLDEMEAEAGLEVEAWMTNTEYLTESLDSPLQLENWMADPSYLNDADTDLEIESWMVEEQYLIPSYLIPEEEVELPIEDWMTR